MISEKLLILRQQMYAAHTNYLVAWSAYTSVPPKVRTLVAAEACRTTGALLEPALTALIGYLELLEADGERIAEMKRAQRIQGALHRELALIAKATDAGGDESEVDQ